MSSEQLKIVIATADSSLAVQIVEKLKDKWAVINVGFDIAGDAKRALADFKTSRPPIVIVSKNLPGSDGHALSTEIGRLSGETTVFVLGGDENLREPNTEIIAVPIVNWTDFLRRLQGALPEHLRSKLGVQDRNEELFKKLTEYGRRFSQDRSNEADKVESIVATIPSFFSETSRSLGRASESSGSGAQENVAEKTIFQLSQKKEFFLVILLVIAAVALFMWPDSDRLVSARNIVSILAALGVLGLTLGQAIEIHGRRKQSS